MVKTLTIVGCRPQLIKASPVLKLLNNDILIHTGQHYNNNMSQIFFDNLNIKKPNYNLNVGSGDYEYHIKTIKQKLKDIILKEKPDKIIVYGDTNSTVAGAIIAKEMKIHLIHIEAGLRSFNINMQEEKNRIKTDKLSDLLLCPTSNAYYNLEKESLEKNAVIVGDTMNDLIQENKFFINKNKFNEYRLKEKEYFLCTIHRPINVDNLNNLTIIFNALKELQKPVILPCHPRTQKKLNYVFKSDNIKIINPVNYIDMISLMMFSNKIITDSGGLQKEAHILKIPCVTLRDETEWIESIECGANKLTKIKKEDILNNINSHFEIEDYQPYGDGFASKKICEFING